MGPVEDVGVQGVVAATVFQLAFDGEVVVADFLAGLGGIGVEDDAADWVHRPEQSLPALAEEVGVFPHPGREFGVHVLHGTGPQAQE